MIWVLVFGGVAIAGLAMLIAYAVWLAHKASDVFAELKVLADRGSKLADTISQIEMPERPADARDEDRIPPARRHRNPRRGPASVTSRSQLD